MIKCSFTSVWEDGSEVTTPCEYNRETGQVFPTISNCTPDSTLIAEYITLLDGQELSVCRECHEYITDKCNC